MEALFTWVINAILLGPLQAEIFGELASARTVAPIITEAKTCIAAGIPALAQDMLREPGAAFDSLVRYWLDMTQPRQLVAEMLPQCANLIDAAGLIERTASR
ncbi:hypothetical protein V6B08_11315 [Ferrovibrio sp. MS7]|jgi:hypothetical protein|uniref:hypothetical protein n=1 Tax=Ferrovibrio plantarum TaxID=3119164 RepID=UPI001B42DD76|nr:hypothetical protein [Ferrovibrio sp.]